MTPTAPASLGRQGRGTVLDALGNYDNTLVIGSLSKGFSCMGGFIGCTEEFKRLLKMRSNTYIFGGPVAPPYLEAICIVCDIMSSGEGDLLQPASAPTVSRLTTGLTALGLAVLGGQTPIISVLVGDEADTLRAGSFLFEHGLLRAVGDVPRRAVSCRRPAHSGKRQPPSRVDRRSAVGPRLAAKSRPLARARRTATGGRVGRVVPCADKQTKPGNDRFPGFPCLAWLTARPTRRSPRAAGRELGLDQVDEFADVNQVFEFRVRQPDAEVAFDLHDDADHVHRIQAEFLTQSRAIAERGGFFAGLGF